MWMALGRRLGDWKAWDVKRGCEAGQAPSTLSKHCNKCAAMFHVPGFFLSVFVVGGGVGWASIWEHFWEQPSI